MAKIKVTSTTAGQITGKMRHTLWMVVKPPLWAWLASGLLHAGAIMSIGVSYKPADVKLQKPEPQEGMVVNATFNQSHALEELEAPGLPVRPDVGDFDDIPAELSRLPSPEPPDLPDTQWDIPVFQTIRNLSTRPPSRPLRSRSNR